MAQSTIGMALGLINTITTRVMVGMKGHEEEVLSLPEETIKSLADEFAQKLVSAVEESKKLLKFVRSVPVPAVVRFVASEVFGENNPAGIKFCLDDNFRNNFLGKIELNVPAGELNIHELTKASLDATIRKELTPEFEETALAYLYGLLSKQAHGQTGDLLVNGWWNIFYIKDVNGDLWAVGAHPRVAYCEWYVRAFSVTSPDEWHAGRQVVSRKSAGV